jgi:DNA-binding transcriptional LysR family regulator
MRSCRRTFTIDIRRLRVLRELDSRGTIGATATALHLTPSAVSQQIASLSREAGVTLLARRGRRVYLTPQARILLDHAVAIAAQLECLRADLAAHGDGLAGEIVIGAFSTAIASIIAPVLTRVGGERPRLRLSLHEVEAPECFRRLDSGDLDLVVTVDYQDGPHRSDSRYDRHDLLSDRFDVALPAQHALAARRTVELADLAGDTWILGALGGPCGQVSLSACAAAGFSPDVRHRVNDWGTVLTLVAAGCGVSLVPGLAMPAGPPPGVVVRAVNAPVRPARNVYAAVRSGSQESPAMMTVIDALKAEAMVHPAELGAC